MSIGVTGIVIRISIAPNADQFVVAGECRIVCNHAVTTCIIRIADAYVDARAVWVGVVVTITANISE